MVKHVLILGAGVAGLACAQKLSAHVSNRIRITLVDESDVHVLQADLYEVATAFNKNITEECLMLLKSTVATPISILIDPNRVSFIRDSVVAIDPKKKRVILKNKKMLNYDFLVLALGGTSNFFRIPGLGEFAYPLKTAKDALKLNCALDQLFLKRYRDKSKMAVWLTVGGGGATGVETVCELARSLGKLCRKYHFPHSKIHLQIVQNGKTLAGLSENGTCLIKERFRCLGIHLYEDYRIIRVQRRKITLEDARKRLKYLPNDLLIWTAGVRVSPILKNLSDAHSQGAVRVDSHLRSKKFPEIFAAGDNAYLECPRGGRYPMLAYIAKEQGELVAKNILRCVESRSLISFGHVYEWILLPLGGKYGLFNVGPILFTGFLAWFIRRFVILRYHVSILSFSRALRKWRLAQRLYVKND